MEVYSATKLVERAVPPNSYNGPFPVGPLNTLIKAWSGSRLG